MDTYDPMMAPDAAEWLGLDEQERIDLVVGYHREAHIEVPGETMHAALHTVVENQVAEKVQEVNATMARLLRQGLDRHDAVHAIGAVLAGHVHALSAKSDTGTGNHRPYYRRLAKLSAKRWRKGKC
jgi:hypothetical protein